MTADVQHESAAVVHLGAFRSHVRRHDRRTRDPLRDLSRQFDSLCRSAVDPWEIAAGLEAEGINDAACQRYGYPDVFGLAEALFALVPRRASAELPRRERREVTARRSMLRGLLYALPGLVFVGLMQQAQASGLAVTLVALAAGWSWSQGMAYLGFRTLGWDGEASARRVLRAGMLLGLPVLAASLAAVATLTSPAPAALLAGAGVGVYMVAASVLLVLGRDVALLLALAPGAVAGALLLSGNASATPPLQAGAGVATVAVVLGLGWTATRAPRAEAGPAPRPLVEIVTAADLRATTPHLFYGLLCALALGLSPVTLGALLGATSTVPTWPVALPLVLSMGVIELQLERLRHRNESLLWREQSPVRFATLARRAFLRALAVYLLVVAALCGLVVALGQSTADLGWYLLVLGYAAVAACLFVALVLVSVGRAPLACAAIAAGLAGYLPLAVASPQHMAAGYLAAFTAVFVTVTGVALTQLRSPLVHL